MPFDSVFGQFMTNVFGPFDQAVFKLFGTIQNDLLTWLNVGLSAIGTETFVLLTAIFGVVLCLFKRTRFLGLILVFSAIFVLVVCGFIINPIANRMRPYNACQANSEYFRWYLNAGMIPEGPYSFPSKHTSYDFCVAIALFMYFKKDLKNKKFIKFGVCLIVLATLVACSRIYLMLHYPTDVIAGVLIGFVLGVGVYYLTRLIVNTVHKWIKPFHWVDKIDLEKPISKKLGRPIDSRKAIIWILVLICLCWLVSLVALIGTMGGGKDKCDYKGNDFICMNKADKVYNDPETGNSTNRCKIHKLDSQ